MFLAMNFSHIANLCKKVDLLSEYMCMYLYYDCEVYLKNDNKIPWKNENK